MTHPARATTTTTAPVFRPRPSLILLVGVPGSGKSAVAATLGCVVVSGDRCRDELWGTPHCHSNPHDLYVRVDAALTRELGAGRSVVFDDCNLTRAERRRLIAKHERLGATSVHAVVLETALEECARRLSDGGHPLRLNALRRAHQELAQNPVRRHEGLHSVWHVEDGQWVRRD